jgi:cellulose synthase/poly-beta-1,6-N-acetylglucosamine synthase-like glycosyltransferase
MNRQQEVTGHAFTIGVCASGPSRNLPSLITFLLKEDYGETYLLRKIVVVASGCGRGITDQIARLAESEQGVHLIIEHERRGKAEAINQIMRNSIGELLVMQNGDAYPQRGAIRGLLSMARDPNVGAVSATPLLEQGHGLLRQSLEIMWTAHSSLSLQLNHAGICNHACDELMVFRKDLVREFPEDTINDGAFIGGLVRARGYLVKFSPTSRVKIEVPLRPIDLVRQRRRITFGHVQVWKRLGRPPRTMESMMIGNPLSSLRMFVRTISTAPGRILAIPVTLTIEAISVTLGLLDVIVSTDRHRVWRRNGE